MDKNKKEGVIINAEKHVAESSSDSASSSEGDGWTHGDTTTASDTIPAAPDSTLKVEAQQVQSSEQNAPENNKPASSNPIGIILVTVVSSVIMLAYGYEDELRAALMLKRKPRTFHVTDWESPQENVE